MHYKKGACVGRGAVGKSSAKVIAPVTGRGGGCVHNSFPHDVRQPSKDVLHIFEGSACVPVALVQMTVKGPPTLLTRTPQPNTRAMAQCTSKVAKCARHSPLRCEHEQAQCSVHAGPTACMIYLSTHTSSAACMPTPPPHNVPGQPTHALCTSM